jgi:hypothetical protein
MPAVTAPGRVSRRRCDHVAVVVLDHLAGADQVAGPGLAAARRRVALADRGARSAASRRGSCGTQRPRGWSSTGCRCTTSRRSSVTKATEQLSGTPTWLLMRMTK